METRANHVLIGAFALAVLAAAMGFALWISKSALDREWTPYVVVFEEAVTGLTVGGAVQYNGIQVGEVRRLSLDADNPALVRADVRIASDVPIKTDTRATLTFAGLTGVALIQLSGGSPQAPRLSIDADGRPGEIVAQISSLGQLMASSEDIATTASKVMVRINRLLNDDNVARVSATLNHLEQISAAAAEGRDDIRTVLSEAAAASTRLAELLDGAESVMRRIDSGVAKADAALSRDMPVLIERLDASLASLQRVGEQTDQLLRDNRGALNDFSQQGLAQIGPLLLELRQLVADLDRVSRRLERHPPDFLLGRPGLPEYTPE